MIKVTIRKDTMPSATVIVDENTTIRAAFESQGIDYHNTSVTVNGEGITPDGLERKFADFTTTDGHYFLSAISHKDNA